MLNTWIWKMGVRWVGLIDLYTTGSFHFSLLEAKTHTHARTQAHAFSLSFIAKRSFADLNLFYLLPKPSRKLLRTLVFTSSHDVFSLSNCSFLLFLQKATTTTTTTKTCRQFTCTRTKGRASVYPIRLLPYSVTGFLITAN
jgi:hypothetical protein